MSKLSKTKALRLATDNISIVANGRAQYVIQYPCRELGGAVTTTQGSYSYTGAQQARARMVATLAQELLGFDARDSEGITESIYAPGMSARDTLNAAIARHAKLDPVELIPTALNLDGQSHVKSELARLGLAWDLDSTCSEIESMSDFCHVIKRGGVLYETPKGNIYIYAHMVMTEQL